MKPSRSVLLVGAVGAVAIGCLSTLALCSRPENDDGAHRRHGPRGSVPVANRPAVDPDSPRQREEGWRLVFSDEFSGEQGEPPDTRRWQYDVGAGGWGNKELQRYTDSPRNAAMDGEGRLLLRALREKARDGSGEGSGVRYTSARISTKGRFTTQYARVEARLRIPAGQGLWPAFWLSGVCDQEWPACGEIDILESVDEVPTLVRSRIHGPGPRAAAGIGPDWEVDTQLDKGFHVYGMEWTSQRVDFDFDGYRYASIRRKDLPRDDVWALDHPMRILLNVAVGGRWPGDPTHDTPFPAVMLVDWVRAWERG